MAFLQDVLRRLGIICGQPTDLSLDSRLAAMEKVFLSPPLTEELAAAIRLISPQLNLTTSEKDCEFWQADQNGACWGEYEAMAPLFKVMPPPGKILEIGPGLGRSIVFFTKKCHWQNAQYHAYEGDGTTTRYTLMGPKFEDSFCGNIAQLKTILEYNGIRDTQIFNAKDIPLAKLPGPYDFIYSFYCIGFHWSLEHFLDDILPLMHDKTIGVFTVPPAFSVFPRLKQLSYQIVDWKPVWPKNAVLKILVISKTALPKV